MLLVLFVFLSWLLDAVFWEDTQILAVSWCMLGGSHRPLVGPPAKPSSDLSDVCSGWPLANSISSCPRQYIPVWILLTLESFLLEMSPLMLLTLSSFPRDSLRLWKAHASSSSENRGLFSLLLSLLAPILWAALASHLLCSQSSGDRCQAHLRIPFYSTAETINFYSPAKGLCYQKTSLNI